MKKEKNQKKKKEVGPSGFLRPEHLECMCLIGFASFSIRDREKRASVGAQCVSSFLFFFLGVEVFLSVNQERKNSPLCRRRSLAVAVAVAAAASLSRLALRDPPLCGDGEGISVGERGHGRRSRAREE